MSCVNSCLRRRRLPAAASARCSTRGRSRGGFARRTCAAAASLVAAAAVGLYALSLRAELSSTRAALADASARVEGMRRDREDHRIGRMALDRHVVLLMPEHQGSADAFGGEIVDAVEMALDG